MRNFHLKEEYIPIDRPSQRPRSHLFTVRGWEEEVSNGQGEWRGKVQLLSGGDARYFREWAALVPLLTTMLSEMDLMSEPNK